MTQSLVVYRFLDVIEYFQIVPLIHFRVNFFSCSDIDECIASIWPCDVNATCQNSYGSYTCSCKCGFYGNGQACVYRGKPCLLFVGHTSQSQFNSKALANSSLRISKTSYFLNRLELTDQNKIFMSKASGFRCKAFKDSFEKEREDKVTENVRFIK